MYVSILYTILDICMSTSGGQTGGGGYEGDGSPP